MRSMVLSTFPPRAVLAGIPVAGSFVVHVYGFSHGGKK